MGTMGTILTSWEDLIANKLKAFGNQGPAQQSGYGQQPTSQHQAPNVMNPNAHYSKCSAQAEAKAKAEAEVAAAAAAAAEANKI